MSTSTERALGAARLPVHLPGGPPKHAQLRSILQQLVDEELRVDDPIPSERVLAERFGVSRMTVRQAVEQLASNGRLRRIPGKGTFVAGRKIVLPLQLRSFTQEMRERGFTPGARVLGASTVAADATTAGALAIEPGEPVHRVERLRTADGEPVALERSHVPAAAAPGLLDVALADRSLYTVLEQAFGLVLDSGEQTIEATGASPIEAGLLEIATGTPVLCLIRRSFAAGRVVEYVESRYRGDRYRLHTPLATGPAAPPLDRSPSSRHTPTTQREGRSR